MTLFESLTIVLLTQFAVGQLILIRTLKGLPMSAADDKLAAVTAQIAGVMDRVVASIAALQAQIVDGTVSQEALTALTDAANSLDAAVPATPPAEAPAETPAETPAQ